MEHRISLCHKGKKLNDTREIVRCKTVSIVTKLYNVLVNDSSAKK